MVSANRSVQPIKALQETATALEAAVLECLARPRAKAVHKVRTTTRRIEAQLNLVQLVGGFPPYEDEADKLSKLLKKLRRAAGAVRDLDVQQDLVTTEAASLNGAKTNAAQKEASRLLRKLRKRRDLKADKLEGLLHSVRTRLPKRVTSLLSALEPAEDRTIPEDQLTAMVRAWYREQAESLRDGHASDPDRLHGVRKVAKLARYLAETAPGQAHRAHALAERFEAIQESGGHWHDWLILSELAASQLGDSADLPQRFGTHAGEALAEFKKKLRYRM